MKTGTQLQSVWTWKGFFKRTGDGAVFRKSNDRGVELEAWVGRHQSNEHCKLPGSSGTLCEAVSSGGRVVESKACSQVLHLSLIDQELLHS